MTLTCNTSSGVTSIQGEPIPSDLQSSPEVQVKSKYNHDQEDILEGLLWETARRERRRGEFIAKQKNERLAKRGEGPLAAKALARKSGPALLFGKRRVRGAATSSPKPDIEMSPAVAASSSVTGALRKGGEDDDEILDYGDD